MLLGRDGLGPEENHFKIIQSLAQFGLDLWGEGLRQVHILDPGREVGHARHRADMVVARGDVDQLHFTGIGHGLPLCGVVG